MLISLPYLHDMEQISTYVFKQGPNDCFPVLLVPSRLSLEILCHHLALEEWGSTLPQPLLGILLRHWFLPAGEVGGRERGWWVGARAHTQHLLFPSQW